FGHGPRAAWCDYHEEVAGTVTVMDVVFGNTVAFVTGHNDARGFLWDPLSGNPTCLTDGLIAPGIDPDDCLSEPGKGTQAVVCGGGADGLLWGFILASSNGPGGFSNPGTAGTVTSP
ncbi:MAG TPA: hypothetical protein VNX21_03875, partial [Candidatus Thermoplasmatota archaeon]|nr:hypothetical protein [Candidatus Thermoplasmatota archaeon]